jgi:hypothetical protein
MTQVSVTRRLPRDLVFFPLALLFTWHSVLMIRDFGIGWDAHAYYVAWHGTLYDKMPGEVDAYNYSPLFAQVVWPLTHLPWAVFCALFIGAAGLTIAWLAKPLSRPMAVGLWLFCTPEILSGNVFWLLALCTVLGFSRGTPWLAAAFTKVVPCLGPIWFLVRGEWRPLRSFAVAATLFFLVSFALDPSLWRQWVDFLVDSSDVAPVISFIPPLVYRLPVGLALLVFAARTDRRWLVPVCMVVVSPVIGEGTLALLAAIPRLLEPRDPHPQDAGTTAPEAARSLIQ